jgi:hypothetical protein
MQHVYQCLAGRAPEADASIAEAGRWLRAKLDDGTGPAGTAGTASSS